MDKKVYFENKIRPLTKERALITDTKGNQILIKDGTSHQVSFNYGELQSLKGKDVILTHNHPSDLGFSPQDYSFASSQDIAEFRAVGKTRTFTIIRPKDGWPKDKYMFSSEVKKIYSQTRKKYSNLLNDGKITPDQFREHYPLKAMELIKLKTGVEYEYRRK